MRFRTTLILLVCLAGAVLYLTFGVRPGVPREGAKTETGPQALWTDKDAIKQEDVQRVEIVSAKDPKRVFVKEGDGWRIEEPIQAQANKWQVEDMIRDVVDLKYAEKYAADARNTPSKETTQLDPPQYTVTLRGAGDHAISLRIGGRTPFGQKTYVQRTGDNTIYVADKDLVDPFNKRLAQLRDLRMTNFKLEEVTRIKVSGAENFEIVRAGDGKWIIEQPIRARADRSKAEALARSLGAVYATKTYPVETKVLGPYELDEPRLTATVTYEREVKKPGETKPTTQEAPKKESYEVQLLIGGPANAEGSSYFAKLAGEDTIFEVSKPTFTNTAVKLDDLRDKAIAEVQVDKCRQVEVTLPNQKFAFEKVGGTWKYADGTAAEPALVRDLLNAVRDLRAVSFEDKPLGIRADDTRAVVTITQEGEQNAIRFAVLTQTTTGGNAYVKAGSDPGIAVVSEDRITQFLQPSISYRMREMLTFSRDHARRIEIAQGDRHVVLAKDGTKWSMVEPVKAATDADAVRDLLNDLSVLRAQKVVGQGDAAAFGLDKPAVTIDVTVQPPPKPAAGAEATTTSPSASTGDESKPDLKMLREAWEKSHPDEPLPADLAEAIANEEPEAATTAPAETPPEAPTPATAPAATATQAVAATTAPTTQPAPEMHRIILGEKDDKAYAMVEGNDLVYQVDMTVFNHATAEMHDRTIAKFEVANATGLTLARGDNRADFASEDNKWSYIQDTAIALDDQKVRELLNAVRDARAHHFVKYNASEADLAAYHLDAPALRIQVTGTGSKLAELAIADIGPAGERVTGHYATIPGSGEVFVLTDEQYAKLNKTVSDLERKAATPAPAVSPPMM